MARSDCLRGRQARAIPARETFPLPSGGPLESAVVTVMTRCDYLRWAQASALSGMETFFPPAQANLERALLAIMIRWYCLEGCMGSMHQCYQRWKPSSSQPRLVGELAFVTVMIRCGYIGRGGEPCPSAPSAGNRLLPSPSPFGVCTFGHSDSLVLP